MDLGEFMEQATIAPAFGPVDMTTAANPGAWVSMGKYARLTAVLIKGAGTGGDDPVITLSAGAGPIRHQCQGSDLFPGPREPGQSDDSC